MSSLESTPSTADHAAALAAAAAARAAGLSWRQVEKQLGDAGLRVSHVALRARLESKPVVDHGSRITRSAVVGALLPVIDARRSVGKTMAEVAAELSLAGLRISAASLKVYVGRARAAALATASAPAALPPSEEDRHA